MGQKKKLVIRLYHGFGNYISEPNLAQDLFFVQLMVFISVKGYKSHVQIQKNK